MLNRTVSDARLSLLARTYSKPRFVIACLQDGRPVSFALHGSPLRLFVEHEIDAVDDKAHTASYTYTLQTTERRESWLVRWEYLRDRPPNYDYPLAHVHVNARFIDRGAGRPAAKPLARLHLPTARVALELVLRHLIAEWGVQPKAADWAGILDKSLAGFDERRTTS